MAETLVLDVETQREFAEVEGRKMVRNRFKTLNGLESQRVNFWLCGLSNYTKYGIV